MRVMRGGRPLVRGRRDALAALVLLGLSGGGAMAETEPPGPPPGAGQVSGLLGRTAVSPVREEIRVQGDGRAIRSVVLLPDGYRPGRRYRLLVAIHNFAGDPDGFARLVHAERLRRLGFVVVLPEAAGSLPEWQGPGLTITLSARGPDGRRIDDRAGLLRVITAARRLYGDPADGIDLLGFSQGATVALSLARRLDAERAGTVRHLVLAAGSVAEPADASLALPGTDILLYDPGRNGPQDVANLLTGEPDARVFIPWILAAKGCAIESREAAGGIDRRVYRCGDGRRLVHLYEEAGEHAWPGQDREFDSALLGRGSLSRIDLTALVASALTGRRGRPR